MGLCQKLEKKLRKLVVSNTENHNLTLNAAKKD